MTIEQLKNKAMSIKIEQLETEIEIAKTERNIAIVFTVFFTVVLVSIAFNNYWATL